MTGVPVEQLRAMIRMLWPAEITPTAKRQLEALCAQAGSAYLGAGECDLHTTSAATGSGSARTTRRSLLGPLVHQPFLRMERDLVTTAQQPTEAEIARAERLRLSDLLTEHRNDIADACRDPRAAVALVALLLRMASM